MTAESIISDWKKKKFTPITWLEGEEEYYIDQVTDFAEHHILTESEAGFNLTLFYGRDAQWTDVVNACRRYPMFADRQVVLLKEAQHMKDIDKLESYIENPSPSTVFVVAYKEKKLDGRSKLSKMLKSAGVLLSTKKMYENQLPDWTESLIQSKGYSIQRKALMLLVDHIGNDLNRLANEIDKVMLNLGSRKEIVEDDIEKYVGISKEYNAFELQSAYIAKDLPKAIRIIQYYESNPKAAPIQLVLPTIYNFFSKLYMIHGLAAKDEKSVAAALGINPYFVKDYITAMRNYSFEGVERALLILHDYNLKSIGIGSLNTVSQASLMKEMAVKIIRDK